MTLTPAGLLSGAADIITRNRLAIGELYRPTPGRRPKDCPVDVLGALAVAADLPPDIWDGIIPDLQRSSALYRALDALADHLDLDDDESYQDAIGTWSDETPVAVVVEALRAASLKAPGLALVGAFDERLVDGPNGGA
jgi:hypothetical protein